MSDSDPARVSIVTPFLNAGRFIRESIESVLAQTYAQWELLLVDDGSTDGSSQIALEYAQAYPRRIRYLAHSGRQNHGASASRNLAGRHAKGEFLAYLDADDVYLPRKLERQVPILDAHPDVAMVYAASEYWFSWTGRKEDADRDWTWCKFGAPPGTIVDPPRMLMAFLKDGGTVPCMGSVLVRRTAVEQVGGWEESFRTICTDQVFHAKLALTFPMLIADACWDRYRQHDGSSSHTVARAGQSAAALDRYLTWLEAYLSHKQITDPAIWQSLRTAQRRYRHPWLHRAERGIIRYETQLRNVASRVLGRSR